VSGDEGVLVLTVAGMHCPSCGLLIDEVVEGLPGVSSSETDVRAGRTVVRLATGDPSMPEPAAVVEAILELGYQATPIGREGDVGSGRGSS
jgi:copper chaperone